MIRKQGDPSAFQPSKLKTAYVITYETEFVDHQGEDSYEDIYPLKKMDDPADSNYFCYTLGSQLDANTEYYPTQDHAKEIIAYFKDHADDLVIPQELKGELKVEEAHEKLKVKLVEYAPRFIVEPD